jgi:hypothetical protein
MIIARKKKKENIAEYILYMWQIEDVLRANKLDFEKIKISVIDQFDQPDDIKEEMILWYKDLIHKMKEEGKEEKGHLSFIDEITDQLEALHKELLKSPDELKYIEAYNLAKPNIKDLQKKSGFNANNDVEVCLTALYGFLLLRLRNKETTIETRQAMATFSNLLSMLSNKYKSIINLQ